MKKKLQWIVVIIAYIFLIIGVIGLILPILPGWPFFVIGLFLLGEESKISKWVYKHLPPQFREILHKVRNRKENTKQ